MVEMQEMAVWAGIAYVAWKFLDQRQVQNVLGGLVSSGDAVVTTNRNVIQSFPSEFGSTVVVSSQNDWNNLTASQASFVQTEGFIWKNNEAYLPSYPLLYKLYHPSTWFN